MTRTRAEQPRLLIRTLGFVSGFSITSWWAELQRKKPRDINGDDGDDEQVPIARSPARSEHRRGTR